MTSKLTEPTIDCTDHRPFSVADVKPYEVPARLDDLQGPDHGVVTLPRDVAWSGRQD